MALPKAVIAQIASERLRGAHYLLTQHDSGHGRVEKRTLKVVATWLRGHGCIEDRYALGPRRDIRRRPERTVRPVRVVVPAGRIEDVRG